MARGQAQKRNRSQAACRSSTAGMRVSNLSCSARLSSSCRCTNASLPSGVPKTRRPCWSGRRDQSPVQTTASESPCMSAIPGGSSPGAFHTRVLPRLSSTRAWRGMHRTVGVPCLGGRRHTCRQGTRRWPLRHAAGPGPRRGRAVVPGHKGLA